MKPSALILSLALSIAAYSGSAHPGHESELIPLFAAANGGIATSALNEASITIEGNYRIIHANGIPDHTTGPFPNPGNPNHIAAQKYSFRVPLKPVAAAKSVPLGMYPFGVAVNGVVFDPGAAEWWHNDPRSHWQYEAMGSGRNLGLDQNHAHVQPDGAYHYHAVPVGLLDKLATGKSKVVLLGWAADGFPIYGPWSYSVATNTSSAVKKLQSSYRLKAGERPDGPGGKYDGSFVADYEYVKGSGDLDECNGRFGITPEFPEGTYYYVLTDNFPFIPRSFRGTPDSSFFRRPPPGGFPRGRPPGAPPPGGPPPL